MSEHDIHNLSWGKSILKYGKWYIISSLFTKGIGIILLPVFTHYLSPSEYGILNSLNAVTMLLPIFISLYLDSAFGRFFHDVKKDHDKSAELFSTIFWFVSIFGVLVVALSLLTARLWVPGLLQVPVWPYAFLAFVPALFGQLGQLGIVFLRQSLLARQTTIVEVSSMLISIIITLPLLIIFNLGVIARLIGVFFASSFLVIFYVIYFWRKGLLSFKFNYGLLFACLAYSIPLIPNIAGGWIAGLSDRLVLAKYADLKSVGIYSLGYQLAFSLYIVSDAITQVQGPMSMSGLVHDRENTKRKIAKFITSLLAIMLVCHLALVLFSREILYIFTDKRYFDAYKVIGIIGFSYVLSSLYRVFSDIVSYHKKTFVISIAAIIMGTCGLTINLLFVPRFGYLASGVANLISTFVYTAIIFIACQIIDKIKIEWADIWKILGIYTVILLLALFYLMRNVSFGIFVFKILLIVFAGEMFYRTAYCASLFSTIKMYYGQIITKGK